MIDSAKKITEYRAESRESYTDLSYCDSCRVFHEWDQYGQRDQCKNDKTYQINQIYAQIVVEDIARQLLERLK
jgi:hypothetical protein